MNRAQRRASDRRSDRYRRRRVSARIVQRDRLIRCGRVPLGSDVGVHRRSSGEAYFSGLTTCGSIWACPVCSAKVRHRRSTRLASALDRHLAAGGGLAMMTLTTQHNAGDSLAETLEAVMSGWRKDVLAGSWWKGLSARFGITGWVRSVEITYGANGWHPHIHALLLLDEPLQLADRWELESRFAARWVARQEKRGRSCSAEAQALSHVTTPSTYVAKVQDRDGGTMAHLELLRSDLKTGKGSAQPFDFLDFLQATGEAKWASLWNEYVETTHGRRAITAGGAAKDMLGAETDDELAVEEVEAGSLVAMICIDAWRRIFAGQREIEVLEAVEAARPGTFPREWLDLGLAPPPGSDRSLGPSAVEMPRERQRLELP